jgi:hypothetical protein
MSPKSLAKVPSSYEPPSEAESQPKPFPALFFRFWDRSQTHCFNSANDGFIAGKYMPANVLPNKSGWDITDVFHHVEQTKFQGKFDGKDIEFHMPSPFISVSSNFLWTLRRAIMKRKESGKDIFITVLSGKHINPATATYAKPYIDRCKRFKAFTGGE